MATVDGEKLRATKKITNDWYNQPREKRRRAITEEAKPIRRSKRFNKEQNTRLDKL